MADAWHGAERGETVEPQDTVTFLTWSSLASVMTNRRYEILQHLHEHPAPSVRALARSIGRDFKRVYEDVTALTAVGLIEHENGMLRVDYDEIEVCLLLSRTTD